MKTTLQTEIKNIGKNLMMEMMETYIKVADKKEKKMEIKTPGDEMMIKSTGK